jgi:hypothetical protein
VHRAVPYPVLLLSSGLDGQQVSLSMANKRWAQNEAGKVVLDGSVIEATLDDKTPSPIIKEAFVRALAVGHQTRTTLYSLYQSWIDTLQSLHAARLTGIFATTTTPEHAASRRTALHEIQRLDVDVTRLRNAAAKEKQMARQVDLNLQLQRIQTQIASARKHL